MTFRWAKKKDAIFNSHNGYYHSQCKHFFLSLGQSNHLVSLRCKVGENTKRNYLHIDVIAQNISSQRVVYIANHLSKRLNYKLNDFLYKWYTKHKEKKNNLMKFWHTNIKANSKYFLFDSFSLSYKRLSTTQIFSICWYSQ